MGTNSGVGAPWLRRRGGVLAGAVGLLLVVAVVAVQMRNDGPAVIRLAAGSSGGDTLASVEMDAGPARADMLLWAPVEYRFVLEDGGRIGPGEARAWTLEAPTNLEAAANDLAARFGLSPVGPAPYGDGFVAGEVEGGGPSLWVGPGGEWSYHAPNEVTLWDCIEPAPALPDPPDEDEAAAQDGGSSDEPTSDEAEDAGPKDRGPDAVDGEEPETLVSPAEPSILLAPDGECAAPEPPAGVPTEGEARSLAEELFADLGLPGDVTTPEVWADEWGAWVHGAITFDGVPTDLAVAAGWGADAAVTSVSSTLAVPVDAGAYPTVDAEEAVRRLEEQGAGWGGLPAARPVPRLESLDAAVSSDDVARAPAQSSTADNAASDDAPAPMPMPTEPAIDLPAFDPDAEPEVVTVTLVDVAPVLVMQWDVDGTTWLLPGYRFTDADGGIWQVMAVSDDYLDVGEPEVLAPGGGDPNMTDPPEPEPGVRPDPSDGGTSDGGTDGAEPEPGDGVPGTPGAGDGDDPDSGGTDASGGVAPGTAPDHDASPEARDLAHRVIGMSEQDATEVVEAAGLVVRVIERDGEGLPHTDDHQPDRINLHVEEGVVVHTSLG